MDLGHDIGVAAFLNIGLGPMNNIFLWWRFAALSECFQLDLFFTRCMIHITKQSNFWTHIDLDPDRIRHLDFKLP